MSHRKKKQRTQRLILKSDGNVSTEIKCNGVDNESSSRAILSRNKKKTTAQQISAPLSDYSLQYSCVID